MISLSPPVWSQQCHGSTAITFTIISPLLLSPASLPARTRVLWLRLQEGEMFYCSHISPSLTSNGSSIPSLQNSVPWDPSAPPLNGRSDTSGNWERIKCSVSTSVSEKWERVKSLKNGSRATSPDWHVHTVEKCNQQKFVSATAYLWARLNQTQVLISSCVTGFGEAAIESYCLTKIISNCCYNKLSVLMGVGHF